MDTQDYLRESARRQKYYHVQHLQWGCDGWYTDYEEINTVLRAYSLSGSTHPPWMGTVEWKRPGSVLFQSTVGWQGSLGCTWSCKVHHKLWIFIRKWHNKKEGGPKTELAWDFLPSFFLHSLILNKHKNTKSCFTRIVCVGTCSCGSRSGPRGPWGNIYNFLSHWMLLFMTTLHKSANVLISPTPKNL